MRVIPAPAGPQPALFARAYKQVSQPMPLSAWVQVTFEAIADAADGAMTPNGFTVPSDGVYDLGVVINIFDASNPPKAGDYINVAVRKNGIEVLRITETTLAGNGGTSAIGTGLLRLAAGDTLQVWAYIRQGRPIYGSSEQITTFTVANWRP